MFDEGSKTVEIRPTNAAQRDVFEMRHDDMNTAEIHFMFSIQIATTEKETNIWRKKI